MIERLAQVLRIPAGAHVETVRGIAGVEKIPSHADDVTGIATAFETVQQDDFTARSAFGTLCLHQNLSIVIGTNQAAFHGEAREVIGPGPEIAQDGEDVRVIEKRLEWPQ